MSSHHRHLRQKRSLSHESGGIATEAPMAISDFPAESNLHFNFSKAPPPVSSPHPKHTPWQPHQQTVYGSSTPPRGPPSLNPLPASSQPAPTPQPTPPPPPPALPNHAAAPHSQTSSTPAHPSATSSPATTTMRPFSIPPKPTPSKPPSSAPPAAKSK